MDRQHFYQLPESIEQHPYLRWHVDPRLKRYIHQRMGDGGTGGILDCQADRDRVLEVALILVEEVRQLPLDCQSNALPARNLSGSMTAFIAHILFSERKVRLNRTVENLQHHFHGTELRDVYQIGLVVISRPSKFLGNFQPHANWYASLCWYSHNKFQKSLTDELRRLAGDNFKRTNLGLLYRCSSSRLETVLRQLGEKEPQIDRALLLHECFQETVKAKQFSTNNPQPGCYDALLARYRHRATTTNLEIADGNEAKGLLTDLSNIVRNDGQQLPRSLDEPLTNDNEAGTTIGDLVPDLAVGIDLAQHEMRDLAIDLLRQNSPTPRAAAPQYLLFLLYGLGWTQTEAGVEFGCKQTTIGRRHDRIIAKLATEFDLAYYKLPPTTKISIEIQAANIQYLEWLCADYYAELAMELLSGVVEGGSDAVAERFCQRVEAYWQFKFQPGGEGLSRVYAFARERQARM